MSARQPAVYIVASGERGTLYVGVTGWLRHRIWEHREGLVGGFSKAHGVKYLAWYELCATFPDAIRREKQLKKWNRAWKNRIDRKVQSAVARLVGGVDRMKIKMDSRLRGNDDMSGRVE